jgi:hypothetical protein
METAIPSTPNMIVDISDENHGPIKSNKNAAVLPAARSRQKAINNAIVASSCIEEPMNETVLTCFNPLQNKMAMPVKRGISISNERFIYK